MAQRRFDSEVKPGDLIEIDRGLYQHWAIYIGGNEVVHMVTADDGSGVLELLSILDSSTAEVRCDKLSHVVACDGFKINNLLDDTYEPRDPYVIVRDACRMVGRRLTYNVVTRNCEHFVTELRYGKPESRQVKTAATIGAIAAGVAAVALFASLFSGSSEKENERENRSRPRNSRGSRNPHWHHHY